MRYCITVIILNFYLVQISLGSNSYMPFSQSENEKVITLREKLGEKDRDELLSVFKNNEYLHNSFFKYDKDKVELHALRVLNAIKSISNKDVLKFFNSSLTNLNKIKTKNTREINNKNYNLFSLSLIEVLKKYDLGSDYNIYSCSMVKKKWVQNSKKKKRVHNPYAPEMPHCGSKDSDF